MYVLYCLPYFFPFDLPLCMFCIAYHIMPFDLSLCMSCIAYHIMHYFSSKIIICNVSCSSSVAVYYPYCWQYGQNTANFLSVRISSFLISTSEYMLCLLIRRQVLLMSTYNICFFFLVEK